MLYALQSQQGIPQPQANQYQQQPQHTSPMSTQNPAQQMLDAQNRMATMSVSTSPQTATILAPEPARQAPEPAHQARKPAALRMFIHILFVPNVS